MSRARTGWVRVLRPVARGLVRIGLGARVDFDPALLSLPQAIWAPLHRSVIDGVVLFGWGPPCLAYSATDEMLRRYPLLHVLRTLPVTFLPKSGLTPRTFRSLLKRIERGHPLVIFPEADVRTPIDPPVAYPGFARVARRAGLPIALIDISGSEGALSWDGMRHARRGINIHVRLHRILPPRTPEHEAIKAFCAMHLASKSNPNSPRGIEPQ